MHTIKDIYKMLDGKPEGKRKDLNVDRKKYIHGFLKII
jgi:hypothetical protein